MYLPPKPVIEPVSGPAAPTVPLAAADLSSAAVFFQASELIATGGIVRIGNTQAGGWIALQIDTPAGNARVVLDENDIDALILALAHVS